MKKVRVFAPASIANLGCGFDIMGLALDEVGDVLEMSVSEGDGHHHYQQDRRSASGRYRG